MACVSPGVDPCPKKKDPDPLLLPPDLEVASGAAGSPIRRYRANGFTAMFLSRSLANKELFE